MEDDTVAGDAETRAKHGRRRPATRTLPNPSAVVTTEVTDIPKWYSQRRQAVAAGMEADTAKKLL